MSRRSHSWVSDRRGAVAPTVALSLIGLIAVGGIAFDYARMATLDTELQDAADQAALAAATQLDGKSDAITRATAAAQSLLRNAAIFADSPTGPSGDPTRVTVSTAGLTFYSSYNEDTDAGTATTDATAATTVQVTVDGRNVRFAWTPIVRWANSRNFVASAVASLSSGVICKVPPLMICNPNESSGGIFPTASDIGKGLKLEAGGGSTWAPGNYGYLDFGVGAKTVEQDMGANSNVESCLDAATVSTKPGNTAGAPAGINTRFDIYDNGLTAACAQGNGNCSPALDVLKDVIHPQFSAGTPPNETASAGGGGAGKADNCALANGSNPWVAPTIAYLPDPTTRQQAAAAGTPTNMGEPRDICHAVSSSGDCTNGRFGDGNWDRNLYFQVNYGTSGTGWQSLSWLSNWAAANSVTVASISRYNVYRAEVAALSAGTLATRRLAEGSGTYAYTTPRCAAGQAPTNNIKDRRILTAAVVNCTAGGVQGATHVVPTGWVDFFLVQPSYNRARTDAAQIYVEVIGPATRPNGDSNVFQYYYRQRPRLLK